MIPTFSFDPGSMSLWFDPTIISQHEEGIFMDNVMNSALRGDIKTALEGLANAPNKSEFQRGIELLSCIWHEQKHFFDFLFTNYGAYRVRQYFEIYFNTHIIFNNDSNPKKRIGVPLDSALDPIRKVIMGFDLSEDLRKIAEGIKKRKDYLNVDNHVHTFNDQQYEIGGEAQLEALAYLSQITAIQTYTGKESSILMQKMTPESLKPNQRYTWFIPLGQHFGLLNFNLIEENVAHIDTSFILPMIYSSLFCNYWTKRNEEFEFDIPSYRLLWLMGEVAKKKVEYLKLDLAGKWDFINSIVKNKWGATVAEEFEYDLKEEEKLLQKIYQNDFIPPVIKDCYSEYHNLRKKIFDFFTTDPIAIIDTERFVAEILPKVTPMPCFSFPHGIKLDVPETERVIGYVSKDIECNWALIPKNWEQIRGEFSLGKKNSWAKLISEFTPFAKLLINGRNHKTSLGPELIAVENMWADFLKIEFDPLFEFPEERNVINYFYYLAKKNDIFCDFCNTSISAPNGHTLSPWVFRYSKKNADFAIEKIGYINFIQDWSLWVVCDCCFKDFKNKYDWRD